MAESLNADDASRLDRGDLAGSVRDSCLPTRTGKTAGGADAHFSRAPSTATVSSEAVVAFFFFFSFLFSHSSAAVSGYTPFYGFMFFNKISRWIGGKRQYSL